MTRVILMAVVVATAGVYLWWLIRDHMRWCRRRDAAEAALDRWNTLEDEAQRLAFQRIVARCEGRLWDAHVLRAEYDAAASAADAARNEYHATTRGWLR